MRNRKTEGGRGRVQRRPGRGWGSWGAVSEERIKMKRRGRVGQSTVRREGTRG